MTAFFSSSVTAYRTLLNHFLVFSAIYCALGRRADLERLVQWARRKRLSGPRRLYEQRLVDEEQRLMWYTFRHPQMMRWTKVVYKIFDVIFPPPRKLTKGTAGKYRYRIQK